jgi:hypothetical protein
MDRTGLTTAAEQARAVEIGALVTVAAPVSVHCAARWHPPSVRLEPARALTGRGR